MAKLFTKEEKEAIETVLDMGFTINNCRADTLSLMVGTPTIVDQYYHEREYSTIESALVQFIKRDNNNE